MKGTDSFGGFEPGKPSPKYADGFISIKETIVSACMVLSCFLYVCLSLYASFCLCRYPNRGYLI